MLSLITIRIDAYNQWMIKFLIVAPSSTKESSRSHLPLKWTFVLEIELETRCNFGSINRSTTILHSPSYPIFPLTLILQFNPKKLTMACSSFHYLTSSQITNNSFSIHLWALPVTKNTL